MNIITLDVSELEPPLPMQNIMKAVVTLTDSELIWATHRRKPNPLFDMLDQQNICWQHQQVNEQEHHIFIWLKTNTHAQDLVNSKIAG